MRVGRLGFSQHLSRFSKAKETNISFPLRESAAQNAKKESKEKKEIKGFTLNFFESLNKKELRLFFVLVSPYLVMLQEQSWFFD